MKENKITVIGLGYVGLPLSIEFSKHFKVLGFDIDEERVYQLNNLQDKTDEANLSELKKALRNNLKLSSDRSELIDYNIYVITVPTPITDFKTPDLTYLESASELVGSNLKKGDLVIYESTVYPGCTEEVCVPILENFQACYLIKTFIVVIHMRGLTQEIKLIPLRQLKVTAGSTPDIAEKLIYCIEQLLRQELIKPPI